MGREYPYKWVTNGKWAWLRVPRKDVDPFGLQFSCLSKMDDEYYYLDENHDSELFLDAKYGPEVPEDDHIYIEHFPYVAGVRDLSEGMLIPLPSINQEDMNSFFDIKKEDVEREEREISADAIHKMLFPKG